MRSTARFMNLNPWVDWGNQTLDCFDNLPKEMQDAYSFSFVLEHKELLVELKIAVNAVEYIQCIPDNHKAKIPAPIYGIHLYNLQCGEK